MSRKWLVLLFLVLPLAAKALQLDTTRVIARQGPHENVQPGPWGCDLYDDTGHPVLSYPASELVETLPCPAPDVGPGLYRFCLTRYGLVWYDQATADLITNEPAQVARDYGARTKTGVASNAGLVQVRQPLMTKCVWRRVGEKEPAVARATATGTLQ